MAAFDSEPNNDPSQASHLPEIKGGPALFFTGSVNGSQFGIFDPHDWYVFTVPVRTRTIIELFGTSAILHAGTGHIEDSLPVGGANYLEATLQAGTYYLDVGDYRTSTSTGDFDPDVHYDLRISAESAATQNHLPVANNDSYSTGKNVALTISTPAILANDSDADFDVLTAVLQTNPNHGTLSLNSNGSFTYTPFANYVGADSFTYRANDGTGNSTTAATVSISVTDTPVLLPDLVVSSFSLGTTTLGPGGSTSIAWNVKNVGSANAATSKSQVYLSTNNILDAFDTPLVSGVGSGLGPQSLNSFSTSITLPSNLTPGNYFILVNADDIRVVGESNESNNTASIQITVPPPSKPDFFVVGSNLGSTTVAAGGSTTFSYWVDNFGTGPAPASQTGIYLSADGVITSSDTLLTFVNTPSLTTLSGAHGVDFATVGFSLPAGLTPGKYYIGAIADYNGQVAESNEINNASVGLAITVTAPPTPVFRHHSITDYNPDSSDILWQRGDGTLLNFHLNGSRIASSAIAGRLGPEWQIAGAADYNGDHAADMLFRRNDGGLLLAEMAANQVQKLTIFGTVGNEWQVIGSSDFNRDGRDDILWQRNDGTVMIFDMNGSRITGTPIVGSLGAEWKLKGTGDYNGDGTGDMLWQRGDGTLLMFEINNNQLQKMSIARQIGNEWQIASSGDFNGDHKTDILFQRGDGALLVADMNGAQIQGLSFAGGIGKEWSLEGTADYNNNGTADLLWQRGGDGALLLLEMANNQVNHSTVFGFVGGEWHIL